MSEIEEHAYIAADTPYSRDIAAYQGELDSNPYNQHKLENTTSWLSVILALGLIVLLSVAVLLFDVRPTPDLLAAMFVLVVTSFIAGIRHVTPIKSSGTNVRHDKSVWFFENAQSIYLTLITLGGVALLEVLDEFANTPLIWLVHLGAVSLGVIGSFWANEVSKRLALDGETSVSQWFSTRILFGVSLLIFCTYAFLSFDRFLFAANAANAGTFADATRIYQYLLLIGLAFMLVASRFAFQIVIWVIALTGATTRAPEESAGPRDEVFVPDTYDEQNVERGLFKKPHYHNNPLRMTGGVPTKPVGIIVRSSTGQPVGHFDEKARSGLRQNQRTFTNRLAIDHEIFLGGFTAKSTRIQIDVIQGGHEQPSENTLLVTLKSETGPPTTQIDAIRLKLFEASDAQDGLILEVDVCWVGGHPSWKCRLAKLPVVREDTSKGMLGRIGASLSARRFKHERQEYRGN